MPHADHWNIVVILSLLHKKRKYIMVRKNCLIKKEKITKGLKNRDKGGVIKRLLEDRGRMKIYA